MAPNPTVSAVVLGIHGVVALLMLGRAAALARAGSPAPAGLSAFIGLAVLAAGIAIYRLRKRRGAD